MKLSRNSKFGILISLLLVVLFANAINANAQDLDIDKIKLRLRLLQIQQKLQEEKSVNTVESVDMRYKQDLNISHLTANQQILYNACRKHGITDNAQMANVFAQVQIESSFVPKTEFRAGWNQAWLVALQNRYWFTGYMGRGLIQLTWKGNYQRMGDKLGYDLVNNPELANDMTVASNVVCIGMRDGDFTGKSLNSYINKDMISYYQARRIVNGLDKADKVHQLSMEWYNILTQQ
jgi:predicted chitinase